ncbi:MAG: phage holin family protein [Candidatus Azobacteroides sp.]|nr:phage holin family protein [Candidatus Azobacteroides sp.]
MESESKLGAFISKIKADAQELIETKIEILRLEILEKTSIVGSFLIYGFIVISVVLFALLFAFIALGLLIGTWMNSMGGGFAIISLVYLIILVIVVINRKHLLTDLQNVFLMGLDSSLGSESQYENWWAQKRNYFGRYAPRRYRRRPPSKPFSEESEYSVENEKKNSDITNKDANEL